MTEIKYLIKPSARRYLSSNAYCSRTWWRDFNEIWHKDSPWQLATLKRLWRSKVKGQGHNVTKCTLAAEAYTGWAS